MSRKKEGRSTTSIQVSRPLDLLITNIAAKHKITKAEAADKVFELLYPDGQIPLAGSPIAPREESEEGEETESAERGIPEVEEPSEVSKELTGTVRDLRTVKTIRALEKDLEGKDEEEEWHLTPQEAFEMRKIEAMFGGGGSTRRSAETEEFRQELREIRELLSQHTKEDVARERDAYRKELEERDARATRAEELAKALEPFQEQNLVMQGEIKLLTEKLEAFSKSLQPESKAPPTDAQLEAIRTLGAGIKDALVEIGKSKGGTESAKLTEYLDSLGAIMDKVTEFAGKKGGGEGPSGEFDYRTAAISTFGEVTKEALKTYREIESSKAGGESEEGSEEEKPKLSAAIVERRVYNHAMKKIAAGELTIDPYKAAEELGLTPTQVWKAIENLRARGALAGGQVNKAGQETSEKTEAKTPEVEGY